MARAADERATGPEHHDRHAATALRLIDVELVALVWPIRNAARRSHTAVRLALQQRRISLDHEVTVFANVRSPNRADLLHEAALLLRQSGHGNELRCGLVVHGQLASRVAFEPDCSPGDIWRQSADMHRRERRCGHCGRWRTRNGREASALSAPGGSAFARTPPGFPVASRFMSQPFGSGGSIAADRQWEIRTTQTVGGEGVR